jgi:uncharacterized RDD family membrane protein YckC
MEYVAGPSLAERLKQGTIPFRSLIRIAIQLTEALRNTAATGVVHGDIKPANVLMLDESNVKLSDFGVANVPSKPDSRIGGTLKYMAPELLRGGAANLQSDMYALGATLFEASFGHLPRAAGESRTFDEMLRAREQSELTFPEAWPREIPESWRDTLAWLLAKDPRQRPDDYDQLLAAFRALVPVSLPDAGLLPRALAWSIDNLLVFSLVALPGFVMAILYGIRLADLYQHYPALGVFMSVAVLPMPLVGSLIQERWGTSPGKKLFNIRISDIHGLPPRPTELGLRAAFQLLPVWALAADGVLASLRLFWLIPVVAVGTLLFFAVDVAAAWFPPRNRTLHDRLLGTRVTVDPGFAARPGED